MITIIFEAHSTSSDNEAQLSSGWNDVALSDLGVSQSKDMGQRRKLDDFDAVFTSDMKRAYNTASLAFDIDTSKLFIDWRLRECDYGELTQHPKKAVDAERPKRISTPFPDGESYEQTSLRMRLFLEDLLRFHADETVLIIGHRATQYGLDRWINNTPLADLLSAPWKWQAGWTYHLSKLN